MIRLFKWVLILGLIIALGTAIWTVLALWAGLYSVYSIPPSQEDPEGSTLIISREEREPLFNSPDYIPPPRKRAPADKKGGINFGMTEFTRMKPVSIRTVFTFPYVEWAYRQSLNEQQLMKLEQGKPVNTARKPPGGVR